MPAKSKFVVNFAIVYLVWGSTYLAIGFGVKTIPPFLLGGLRFMVAGLILYCWSVLRTGARPTRLHWRNAAIVGLLLLVGGNGGVIWAEQTVPSGVTALLVASVPLWMVVVDWIRPGGARPSLRVIVGVAIGLVGMGVLIGFDSIRGAGAIPLASAALIIFAALSWATGSIFAKHAELPEPAVASSLEMISGGVIMLLLSVLTGEVRHLDVHTISHESAIGLAYLIIFGSIVAYSAYTWMVRNAAPAAVGTYAYVNPIVAIFLGWLIAHESVTPRELVGAAIILAAVIIITTARSKTQKPPPAMANATKRAA